MSEHIHNSHNKSLLLYHFVCPLNYRRCVMRDSVSKTFKEVWIKIEERYKMFFRNRTWWRSRLFFDTGSSQWFSEKIIEAVKSITAIEIFRLHTVVKQQLWGGKFWRSGYYVNTVGQFANEKVIKKYLQTQGVSKYEKIYSNQLRLFLAQIPRWLCLGVVH